MITFAMCGIKQEVTLVNSFLQTIWRLCFDLTTTVREVSIQRLYQFQLPYAKQRWVTAALLLANSGILVCGDRGGTIYMFRLTGQVGHRLVNLDVSHTAY